MLMKRLGILLVAGTLLSILGCGEEESDERLIGITVKQEKLEREVGRIITGVKGVRTELDQILALAKKGSAAPGPAKVAHAPRTEAVDLKDIPEYKQLAAAVSAIQQRLNVAQSNVLRTKEEVEREWRRDPLRRHKALQDPLEIVERLDALAEKFEPKISDRIRREEFQADLKQLKWINEANLGRQELSQRLASTYTRWLENPESDAWRQAFENNLRFLESPREGGWDDPDKAVEWIRRDANFTGLRRIIQTYDVPPETLDDAGLPDTSGPFRSVEPPEGEETRAEGDVEQPKETEPTRSSPENGDEGTTEGEAE